MAEILSVWENINFFLKNNLSETFTMRHGVPQESVLSPLLFALALLHRSCNIIFRCYADDLQLCEPLTIESGASLSKLEACLSANYYLAT